MNTLPRKLSLTVYSPLPKAGKGVWSYAQEHTKDIDLEHDAEEHITGDHSNFYVHIYRRRFMPFTLHSGWLLRFTFNNTNAFYLRSVRFMTPRAL